MRRGHTRLTVAVLLTLAVLATASGALVFAQDPEQGQDSAKARPATIGSLPLGELRQKAGQVWDNHVRFLELRLECARTMERIRERTRELREGRTALDDSTRQALKEACQAIKTSAQTLRGTIGQIRSEAQAMRGEWRNRDWERVREHLGRILDVQETRLAELEKIKAELEHILELLG